MTSPSAAETLRERVLVVDDDPPLARMLERTLTAEGFAVTVASDGGGALVAAERCAPDVIVSTSPCRGSTGSPSAAGCGTRGWRRRS